MRAHVSLPSSTAARHLSLWYTTTHHAVKACRVRRWAKPCLRACEASSKRLSLHWCSMELSSNRTGIMSSAVVQIEVDGIWQESKIASVFDPSCQHHLKPRLHLTRFHLFLAITQVALPTSIYEPSRLPGGSQCHRELPSMRSSPGAGAVYTGT